MMEVPIKLALSFSSRVKEMTLNVKVWPVLLCFNVNLFVRFQNDTLYRVYQKCYTIQGVSKNFIKSSIKLRLWDSPTQQVSLFIQIAETIKNRRWKLTFFVFGLLGEMKQHLETLRYVLGSE